MENDSEGLSTPEISGTNNTLWCHSDSPCVQTGAHRMELEYLVPCCLDAEGILVLKGEHGLGQELRI